MRVFQEPVQCIHRKDDVFLCNLTVQTVRRDYVCRKSYVDEVNGNCLKIWIRILLSTVFGAGVVSNVWSILWQATNRIFQPVLSSRKCLLLASSQLNEVSNGHCLKIWTSLAVFEVSPSRIFSTIWSIDGSRLYNRQLRRLSRDAFDTNKTIVLACIACRTFVPF